MDWRPGLLLLTLLVAGCTSTEEPRHPTAEELSVAYSPAAPEEPPAEPEAEEGRQSRPASQEVPRSMENITPARWQGNTADERGVCLPPGGCVTIRQSADDSHRVGLDGRVWGMRVTVTWDAMDDATRELAVSALGEQVVGPSPLVLEGKYRSEEEGSTVVKVKSVRSGILQAAPSQPFSAVAEFNV